MTSDQERAAPAQQPVAWLGESVGFKSFTRQKAVAARWKKGRIEVTAVYAPSEPELKAEIVRLTRERDEHERMRTLYVTSAQEEHARAEAAESRIEALSAEVGTARAAAFEEAAQIAEEAGKPYLLHTATGAMMFRATVDKIAAAIRSRAALDKGATR